MPSSLLFHIARADGTTSGPHSAAFIRQALTSGGDLDPNSQLCVDGTVDWLPLMKFAPEIGLPKPRPPEDPVSTPTFLMTIILIIGIIVSAYALSMETSVSSALAGDTFNLSKAHNQSNILAIGLTLVGSALISLGARAGRKP